MVVTNPSCRFPSSKVPRFQVSTFQVPTFQVSKFQVPKCSTFQVGVENVLPKGFPQDIWGRERVAKPHRWGGGCLWVFGWQGIAHTGGEGFACGFSVGKALRTPVWGWFACGFSVGKALRTPAGGFACGFFRLARHCAHRWEGWVFGLARRRVSRWEGFVLVGGISGSVRNKQDLECFVVENQRIDQSCCVC